MPLFLWITLILTLIVASLAVLGIVLTRHPVFGSKPSTQKRLTFTRSKQYNNEKFQYPIPTDMRTDFRTGLSILRDFTKKNPHRQPGYPIPMTSVDPDSLKHPVADRWIWFGHSALLLQINGKSLLLDPMFGDRPSPVPFFGLKRFSEKLPVEIEQLPEIDAVLFSHDHYDHLDYGTIKRIRHKVKQFIVPLGLGSHLERWGVLPEQISEMDWWEETELDGLKLACTPARHYSGRGLSGRDASLWCSWVIQGDQHKVYFSGDSGYGPHFKEIGAAYGPFDATFMECGQYDERWSAIHMMPEETVQAHLDVKGKLLFPIHWSAFTLAFHSWTDPVERAKKAAEQHDLPIATPRIGEPVTLGAEQYPATAWWTSS
ncbi:MBL fold metallo-hydrolase [Marinicrinis sediminis]|uniref:MBL fold metallo-hydrolase n=1 Tax=Marinicrinis sediminis TaxID=1652465 RepID=A0ABW5RF31_9BACL